MKYKFRGQLTNLKMVDIFDFKEEYALCDHDMGKIHIDEFQTVFVPVNTFKEKFIAKKKAIRKKQDKDIK